MSKIGLFVYCGSWLIVAIYSAYVAWTQNEPRFLILTSTASMNALVFTLTGETRSKLRKLIVPNFTRGVAYLVCGLVALGGVWLSVYFDEPRILTPFMFIAFAGFLFAWALT